MTVFGAAAPSPSASARHAPSSPTARAVLDDRERLFVTLLMAAFTSPGFMFLGVTDALDAPETPLLRYYWLPIYAAVVGLAAWRWRTMLRFVIPIALAFLVVGWAYASKSWSVLPDVTGRRVMALAFTTLFGLYLGAVWGGRRLPEMLADAILWLAVGSFATAVLVPSIGVHHDAETAGAWRGLFPHKNMLGSWMVLGSLSAVSAAFTDPASRRRRFATLALCAFLLVMCRSKGLLVVWMEVMAAASIFALARRGPVWAVAAVWIAGVVGTGVGLIAILRPEAILGALGKSPTLTGRTDIWASVLRRVSESPWLGYGYAAFWEKGSIPAEVVKKETGWLVPSAHNGWLDLLLQVGWIGIGLLVVLILIALLGCIFRSRARVDGYFGILFLIYYFANSISESVLELHNSLPWALFIAVLAFACGPSPERPVDDRREGRRRPDARAPAKPAFDWTALDAGSPFPPAAQVPPNARASALRNTVGRA